MDYEFMVFLDQVRDACAFPFVVTSDARTIAEELAQPVHAIPPESGLHVFDPAQNLWCRAVDLRWLSDPTERDTLVAAVYRVRGQRPTELELVPFTANAHTHVGLFRTADHPARLEFSAS